MNKNKYKSVKSMLWIILFANFAVAAIKIFVGSALKSQSAIADGLHSYTDGASNIAGLIGIWLSNKPYDDRHPYGHGKYEIVASLFIGVMLAIMSFRIISRAALSFKKPVMLKIDLTETMLLILTVIINAVVAFTEYRAGKRLESTILVTDSLHTRGDIMVSCSVLLGLIGIRFGLPPLIDGVLSIAVAFAVMLTAWQIIKSCVDIFVDSSAVDGNEVKALLMTVPGVNDIHKVRSRGDISHLFIDLHVIINPKENVTYSHELSHKLETALKEHFGAETEAYIHIEPDDMRNAG